MPWKRDAKRVLVLDEGLAKVAAAPTGGGCFVEAFGASIGRVALDELAAQRMLEKLVVAARGVGAWSAGYCTGCREGLASAARKVAEAGYDEAATVALGELERRFGRP